jgi:metal-responsive CopG/Arc/MetJ family transcriptional regulator
MPIVPRVEKIEMAQVSVRLPAALVKRLDAYCKFVERGRADVLAGLLEYAFDRDKEFAQHEASANIEAPAVTIPKRRRDRVEPDLERLPEPEPVYAHGS